MFGLESINTLALIAGCGTITVTIGWLMSLYSQTDIVHSKTPSLGWLGSYAILGLIIGSLLQNDMPILFWLIFSIYTGIIAWLPLFFRFRQVKQSGILMVSLCIMTIIAIRISWTLSLVGWLPISVALIPIFLMFSFLTCVNLFVWIFTEIS